MHYTLHLTNDCNMACGYCYVKRDGASAMSLQTARKAVDLAASGRGRSAGIIFFGGEPLLHKDLIYETVAYGQWKERNSDCLFHYKVTTNGLLLDEAFMDFSLKHDLFVALSHDGIKEAHDRHRVDRDGRGTFGRLSEKMDLLLSKRPYAPVLMTINSDTARYYAESAAYLFDKGFRYLICSLNYAGSWDENSMGILKREYGKLARFYLEKTRQEEKFYLSPFEVKISSHINRDTYCSERCELGKKQISVSTDGGLFPCVQFVGDDQYRIGSVYTGIDEEKRGQLFALNGNEKESCKDCAIRKRCNHYCGCLNKQATGSIEKVSPALCMNERLLMPIADRLAEKLYKRRNGMFIQKHYNDMYPLVSLIEDQSPLSPCTGKSASSRG